MFGILRSRADTLRGRREQMRERLLDTLAAVADRLGNRGSKPGQCGLTLGGVLPQLRTRVVGGSSQRPLDIRRVLLQRGADGRGRLGERLFDLAGALPQGGA